jgi:hypothetical protein
MRDKVATGTDKVGGRLLEGVILQLELPVAQQPVVTQTGKLDGTLPAPQPMPAT